LQEEIMQRHPDLLHEEIMQRQPDLIVFSHLRWNFVYQRPQHLLSRLAARRQVIFIEEPVLDESAAPHWEQNAPEPNVLVCRPHTPVRNPGFSDEQIPALSALLQELVAKESLRDYVVWFYSPMALPLTRVLLPQATVYDCMDELSAFLNAPPQLLQREAELLAGADVVFTGGPSLYRAKKDRHPNIHCFPSSVDAKHFGQARAGLAETADQAALPRPRLGYFGVIDERIDAPLLDALARAHPEWQLTLVGPIVKIDPAVLPRRLNIHYFGQRDYAQLPAYLTGWDVCLLPFARNAATRYISPTKTLEYMAAERPIVSTPITDVAESYGEIVYLGDTPEAFVAACEKALAASEAERSCRTAKMRAVLARTSWDATARAMEALVEEAVERQKARSAKPSSRNRSNGRASGRQHTAGGWKTTAVDAPAPVVVVGAGPTGLSAAYHLGADALLLEQKDKVGGWCRSLEVNSFTFDFAGHIMFSNDPYVHQMYNLLLGDNVHWQDREAWIYSKNVYTRYPFQGALYGLPPQVIKECIVGAIEARFGSLKRPPAPGAAASNGNGVSKNGNGAPCKNGDVKDCCADGILESTAPLRQPGANGQDAAPPGNFEEFIYRVWGAGIAKHFAVPYNRKLWAVPLSEMETSWLGGRVPMPDLVEMIEGVLQPVPKPMGPNARFGYPLRGGFQALMDGFLSHVQGQLRLNTGVVAVSPGRRTVTLTDGSELRYEYLISTMPLPVLVRCMGEEAPPEVRRAAAGLRYVSVRCVHLGVGREKLTEKHWIYYPEDTVFHRIFVQGNASPHCNPPGGFGLTCEITYSEHKPLPCDGDDLIRRCVEDCHKVGFFRPEDPVWAAVQCDLPHAYVVYDHARPRNVAVIREWLAGQDIILAGRYSEWEYYNSDHAFLAGKKAAERVRALRQQVVAAGENPRALVPARQGSDRAEAAGEKAMDESTSSGACPGEVFTSGVSPEATPNSSLSGGLYHARTRRAAAGSRPEGR
jgi:UDP-galactopyranose mutase